MKSNPFALRLYIFLTLLEVVGIGIPIIQARSLTTGGYSLPRLLLLLAWLAGFGICVWISISAVKKTALSEKIKSFLQAKYFVIKEWLVVFSWLSWGMVAIFFLRNDFLTYILSSLPTLIDQYLIAIIIFGVWGTQSLLALRAIAPEAQVVNASAVKAVQVFLAAFFFYVYTAVDLSLAPNSTTAYFPELAQSFLQGRLDLINPPVTKDLTLFDGKYYVSFPPLGALLMLPVVASQGIEDVNIIMFNSVFAALGVMFTFLTLEAMKAHGLSELQWWGHAALALFLGFGTAQYSLTLRILVNFTGQILTTTFLALSLWFVLGLRRNFQVNALLAGGALGLAMLARPNVIFAWFAVAALQWQILQDTGEFSAKRFFQWLVLSLVPVFALVMALFWYNQARFGSPLDFGYTNMLVAKALKNDLVTYGQFNPHFILINLRDNFLRLPYWDEACQMFTPRPQGTSILFASPLVIYLFSTFKRKTWIFGAWISIGAIALLHSMYYNSGAVQVGYRFSLDFMPIVVMLLAFGFKKKLPHLAVFLIAFSIAVNYIGVLWSTHRWCENF